MKAKIVVMNEETDEEINMPVYDEEGNDICSWVWSEAECVDPIHQAIDTMCYGIDEGLLEEQLPENCYITAKHFND